jgi:formiminotetrahydrofolate cyclodeaminase
MIKEHSIQLFLDELASKSPTPGGGSSAAIMGAMGAALLSMVCNLTIGKKNYELVSQEMDEALQRSEALRTELLDMVAADVEAFDQVMAAYRLPKDSDADKALRSVRIQDALKMATAVPLRCARACASLIELSEDIARHGNKNVISDAGVAVVSAHAALRSAALNVHVNVGAIRDGDFTAASIAELESIMAGQNERTELIYRTVQERL